METEWWPINGASRYSVSTYGEVANRDGLILRQRQRAGYWLVDLWCDDGSRRTLSVHRLVAEAFCYHPEGYDVVHHKDGNGLNNRAENLEWTTPTGNLLRSGSCKSVAAYQDGVEIARFPSTTMAARFVSGSARAIRLCAAGLSKTHRGLTWAWV